MGCHCGLYAVASLGLQIVWLYLQSRRANKLDIVLVRRLGLGCLTWRYKNDFEVPRRNAYYKQGLRVGGPGSVRGLNFSTGHVSQLLGIVGSAMGVLHTLIFRAVGYFCLLFFGFFVLVSEGVYPPWPGRHDTAT